MITYTLTKEIVDNETIFKFRGYYNGKLLSTERTYNYWGRSIPSLGTKLYLGVANQINSTPDHHFKGTLDDVRIYKGALTPDEVGKLYEKEKLGQMASHIIVSSTWKNRLRSPAHAHVKKYFRPSSGLGI